MVPSMLRVLLIAHCLFSLVFSSEDIGTPTATILDADGAHDAVKRQDGKIIPTGVVADTPMRYNGVPGTTVYYSFEVVATPTSQPQQQRNSLHQEMRKRSDEAHAEETDVLDTLDDDLQKRQSANTIYVSINTCQNPTFNRDEDRKSPPQMSLLISTVASGQELGSTLPNPQVITLNQGFAMRPIQATDGAVVIGVAPPNADINRETSAFVYDLAVSRNGPYHDVQDDVSLSLKLVDSDPSAGLLITEDLEGWSRNQTNKTFGSLDHGPPLNVFANNLHYTRLNGLQNSYCAYSEFGQVEGNAKSALDNGVQMGVIHQKPNNDLEQQIYLPNLNASSTYLGRLATLNASKYGQAGFTNGGGTLYPLMNFTTKTSPNCAVLFNLSFCADVNYAVPANPARFDRAQLSALYDNRTADLFRNFTWSLQQIPCNTTPTAQYSLAVGCDNCTAAYKTWLCAVSIPKCADFAEHYDMSALPGGVASPADSRFPENVLPDGGNVELSGADDWGWVMPRNLAQMPVNGSRGIADKNVPANSSQLTWIATNSSRNNDTIAGQIQPGPYLEILPCEDLCYDLVRMCPAKLQFACPRPGSMLMRASYGQRRVAAGSGAYTCNAPGAVYFKNGAGRREASSVGWLLGLGLVVFMTM